MQLGTMRGRRGPGYRGASDNTHSIPGHSPGERVVASAHRDNLQSKINTYSKLLGEAERDVMRERELVDLKMPDLKETSKVQGDQDNWLVFDSVSKKYIEAREKACVFDAIKKRAEERLERINNCALELPEKLIEALKQLYVFVPNHTLWVRLWTSLVPFLKIPI